MDLLSRIAGWLGENEATISAVVNRDLLRPGLGAEIDRSVLYGVGGTNCSSAQALAWTSDSSVRIG